MASSNRLRLKKLISASNITDYLKCADGQHFDPDAWPSSVLLQQYSWTHGIAALQKGLHLYVGAVVEAEAAQARDSGQNTISKPGPAVTRDIGNGQIVTLPGQLAGLASMISSWISKLNEDPPQDTAVTARMQEELRKSSEGSRQHRGVWRTSPHAL